MGTWNTPVSTIINRLKDIMVFSDTGNNVTNLALDLLNRAQNWLSMYRQWDYLKKVSALTVGDDHIATLPTDINTILAIYCTNSLGDILVYYHPNANDLAEKYDLFDSFTTTAGHSWYIQFPSATSLPGSLYILYSYNLADIAAADTYTFYPGELLLRTAQKMHIEDKGITGDSVEIALKAHNEQLDNFVRNSQYVNQKMDLSVKDKWGNPIKLQGYRLNGSSSYRQFSPYEPSAILMGR